MGSSCGVNREIGYDWFTKIEGKKSMLKDLSYIRELRGWVRFAICAVIVMFFLIISNGSYVAGDLYSPQVVLGRELFGGDSVYLAFNVLFYGYQLGLIYRFFTGQFHKGE